MLGIRSLVVACAAAIVHAANPVLPVATDGISLITTLQYAAAYTANLTFQTESLSGEGSSSTAASVIEAVNFLTEQNPGAAQGFVVNGSVSEAVQIGALTAWWNAVYSTTTWYAALERKAGFFDRRQKAQIQAYAPTTYRYVLPAINDVAKGFEPKILEGIEASSAFLESKARELLAAFSH